MIILVKHPQETLLEDGRGEAVGEDDHAVGRVRERLHLEKADLVETASEEIDDMAIVTDAFREAFPELASGEWSA